MPPSRQPSTRPASIPAYRSASCAIGTHHECAHSSPVEAPIGIPVIYEACDCPCHPEDDLAEAPR
ncbi:hypothetical protein EF910_05970 [Streptomyces sp. WAC07149]|nr:hypothetical protein EF910_05970 [Streptomyces sp. WAC07149]